MVTRERLDEVAWGVIKTAKVHEGVPSGYALSGRPANFIELYQCADDRANFELAYSEFLHEFYRYRDASFFAVPPPKHVSPGWKAILAGMAEDLSKEFDLPVPFWTEDAAYFLPICGTHVAQSGTQRLRSTSRDANWTRMKFGSAAT